MIYDLKQHRESSETIYYRNTELIVDEMVADRGAFVGGYTRIFQVMSPTPGLNIAGLSGSRGLAVLAWDANRDQAIIKAKRVLDRNAR